MPTKAVWLSPQVSLVARLEEVCRSNEGVVAVEGVHDDEVIAILLDFGSEVREFLRQYRAWLANPKGDYANAEETVGRLFAAAMTDDPEAGRLWRSMRSDAGLDGAAAEDYATAEYDYTIGRKSPTK